MEEISDSEKIRISCNFIKHAPPGEFNEVFNDVRVLLNNDSVLKEGCAEAFGQYNKDQFTPVEIEGASKKSLVTDFNDLGGGRFFDPRSKQSFLFDHLRKEASETSAWDPDSKAEPWRSALQSAIDAYVENHFKFGTASVFGKTGPDGVVTLTVCIESNQFQPKNYWNGRWRSQWSASLGSSSVELKGNIKVQVHYFEDGNVQLVSTKDVARKISMTNEASTAKEMIKVIEDEEGAYQAAVTENYQSMSDTVFKSLRRQLPVTRTKIDWGKILSYKIGSELKPTV